MLTKLLKTLNESRYTLMSGAYFQRTLKHVYGHHEKYLELKHQTSLKTEINCHPIPQAFPNSKKELKKVMGTPNFLIANPSNIGVEILCYKGYFEEFKSEIEFHFYRDILFYYKYTFISISETNYHQILQCVSKKYAQNKPLNPAKEYITDGRTWLALNLGFNLDLHFFTPNHQDILDEFSTRIRKQKKEERRLDKRQPLVYQGL
ncbi:hypothetical protein MWU59_05925 [Flavobacteriaceae bacterium F08102]|nr:hypothetical protein [Flavobacteriaceae bacterium F08102]